MVWYIRKDGSAIQIQGEIIVYKNVKKKKNLYEVHQTTPEGMISTIEENFKDGGKAETFIWELLTIAAKLKTGEIEQIGKSYYLIDGGGTILVI